MEASVNKAVDWIENHPDSPHRLELTEIYVTNDFFLDDVCDQRWNIHYSIGYDTACHRGHVQPMMWIKTDVPGHSSWRHDPERDPDSVTYPEDFA
jgi:hypothetical protein